MYKYCIVPKCTNTSVKTPDKLFFNVPKDPRLRKKWCSLSKRDDSTPLSSQGTRHCCEDHFDLKEDMENYVKFKLVGGRLKLKKGVLPHKFECQQPPKKDITREEVQNVKKEVTEVLAPILEHFKDLLPDVEKASTSPVHTEVIIKEELDIEENDPLQQLEMRQAGVGAADVGCAGDARRDGCDAPVAGTSQPEAWPFETKFTETFIKNEIDPDEEENQPSLTVHTVYVKSEPVEYEVNIKEEAIVPRKRKRKVKGQD